MKNVCKTNVYKPFQISNIGQFLLATTATHENDELIAFYINKIDIEIACLELLLQVFDFSVPQLNVIVNQMHRAVCACSIARGCIR